MNEVMLTQEQLEERLAYWQEKLRLRDWIVSVRKGSPKEVGDNFSASVDIIHCNKTASILILHEKHFPSIDAVGFPAMDIEWNLVHELLHLHTRLINKTNDEDSNNYCMFEEQAIESVTSALLALERGGLTCLSRKKVT